MGNARPLAHQVCEVLAYQNGWVRYEEAEMKFYEGGKYEWIDKTTGKVIDRVMEWSYK